MPPGSAERRFSPLRSLRGHEDHQYILIKYAHHEQPSPPSLPVPDWHHHEASPAVGRAPGAQPAGSSWGTRPE